VSQSAGGAAGFSDATVRRALRELLVGRSSHADFASAIRDLPASARAVRPSGHPHSIWELVEHMSIGQRDLVDYTVDRDAVSPKWPEGYWPDPKTELSEERWNASVAGLEQGLLAADHLAYHLGQIVTVRKALGVW